MGKYLANLDLLVKTLSGKQVLLGKILANGSQFANIFPRRIIALYGTMYVRVCMCVHMCGSQPLRTYGKIYYHIHIIGLTKSKETRNKILGRENILA